MKYRTQLVGKKIIIMQADDGDLSGIAELRQSIQRKGKMLVIDEIRIGNAMWLGKLST